MHPSSRRIKENLTELGSIGRTSAGGVSRFIFTPVDFQARRFVMSLMEEAGLETAVDKVGNIIGRKHGRNDRLPSVMTGSHIDTVPNAGIFDGCAGVIGAIEAIRVLNENRVQTSRPIEVVVFNNEEGVRYEPLVGSKAIAGEMNVQEILRLRDKDGVSFRDAFESGGYDTNKLPEPRKKGKVGNFVEFHIEQGPILERKGHDIGIVETIFGVRQLMVTLRGSSGHAGSTPMLMRRDALLGASKMIDAVNEITLNYGPPAVGTVGWIQVSPGAVNVIGGTAQFGIDLRDSHKDRLESRTNAVRKRIWQIARELSLTCQIKKRLEVDPVTMSGKVIGTIASCTRRLGLKYSRLNSGPYHDTLEMARITDCGMVFVPSRNGISHAPREFTKWNQIANGVKVLCDVIAELAR